MSNSYFQFKQFAVWHNECAMRVGTDGVLLGAWTKVSDVKNVLDVGTGSGLIALMIAQRNMDADITGIELDKSAALQAQKNINNSPWKRRINIIYGDYKRFVANKKFDLIVSNPPYFSDSLKSPENERNTARHTDNLQYDDLIYKSAALLTSNGQLSIIIPTVVKDIVKEIASNCHLYLTRQTDVRTVAGAVPKRTLLNFSFNESECDRGDLTIELSRHVYTKEYIDLTKDYYLNM